MKKKKNFRKLSRKISQTPGLDIDNFEKTCIDLLGLCRIIKDQNDTNQLLLKNFIKIRLVSIVEFNLKGFISSLIDNQDLKPNEILDINLVPFQIKKTGLDLTPKIIFKKKIIELNSFLKKSNEIWYQYLNRKKTVGSYFSENLSFFYNFNEHKNMQINKYTNLLSILR